MRQFRHACLLAVSLSIFAGQSAPTTAPVSLDQIVAGLGSDDFAVRQHAEQDLDRVGIDQKNALARMAKSQKDPEIKARLEARVDAMEEIAATDPPGISMDIKDATLVDIAASLSTSLNTPFIAERPTDDRFTLKADNQPFWEIERLLSAQHPVWFDSANNSIHVEIQPGGWAHSLRVRGFEVCVTDPRPPDVQGVGGHNVVVPIDSPAKAVTVIGLGIDPRIPAAQVGTPQITAIADELHQPWKFTILAPKPGPAPARPIAISRTLALEPPQDHGQTLAISGRWSVMLALEEQHVEIAELRAPPEDPVVIGDTEVAFTQLSLSPQPSNHSANLRLSVQLARARGATPVIRSLPLTLAVLDAKGNVLTTRAISRESASTSLNIVVPSDTPAKMVLSCPTRTREYLVPFEFKALAVRSGL